ncbi:MAG TPA: hypothetical protein VL126_13190 [Bacteroidota bacterium]|nr:hypothetical protein [Bacteroidota bacterium]
MRSLQWSCIAGLIFGAIAAGVMLPMQFSDKRAAITAAFINRFSIGFLIGVTNLPLPGWFRGLLIALFLSLPDALVTKAYVPILGMGCLGGIVIGILAGIMQGK